MPVDRLVAVGVNGSIYEAMGASRWPVGTYYYANPYGIGDGIPCEPAQCVELSGGVLPTRDTSVPIRLTDLGVAQIEQQIGSTALTALSTLNQAGLERLSPALAALNVAASPYAGVATIGDLAQAVGLGSYVDAEVRSSTAALFDSGELREFRPDPGNPSTINQYQRFAMALQTTQKYAPLVDQFRRETLAIFGDDFGSGFVAGDFGGLGGGFSSSFPIALRSDAGASQNPLDVIYGGGAAAPPMSGSGGGTILDTLIGAIPTVLKGVVDLSRAGIIRGSVGQAFGGPVGASAPASSMTRMVAPSGGNMAISFNEALQYALNAVSQSQTRVAVGDMSYESSSMEMSGQPYGPEYRPELLPGNGCGQRGATTVNAQTAMGIYRLGCGPCGTYSLQTRNRFFAERSDGTKDLFVKVGKVQSVSPRALKRFAKRWAREAGLVAGPRGGRGHRRVYRRRRPR